MYIVTDAGEKQYITDDDIQLEEYCDACGHVLELGEGTWFHLSGGRKGSTKHGIDGKSVLWHENCTPMLLLEMLEGVSSSPQKIPRA